MQFNSVVDQSFDQVQTLKTFEMEAGLCNIFNTLDTKLMKVLTHVCPNFHRLQCISISYD